MVALVCDPTRMGEWSTENRGATWLGEASGPAVGNRFRGSNKNGWMRWKTVCTVSECVENEAFAFDVKSGPVPISSWAYRLTAVDGGTEVTEEFTSKEADWIEKLFNKILKIDLRAEFNRVGMEATLDAMAAELESS